MPTPYMWWAGRDEERYEIGPCATRQEAIDEMLGQQTYEELEPESPEHPDWRISFYVCEATQHAATDITIDAERILEDLYDHYSDWLDGDSDDPLFTATPDEVNDLSRRLTEALHAWAAGKKLNTFMFRAIRNAEYVILPHPETPKEIP